jgi:transposase
VKRKPWEIEDGLWERIEPLLPAVERRYHHPGRKRLDQRKILCGILFMLYTDHRRRPRHTPGRHRDRRQPQRRHPAPAPDPRRTAHPGQARTTPRQRPDVLYADRGYDHDIYRRQVRELGIRPPIARRSSEHGSG